MIRAAARRILVLLGGLVGGTVAVSLALGALAHASLLRSLAVGFYVVAAGILVGSFVFGVRGPLRPDWGADAQGQPRRGIIPRAIRRATSDERVESKRNSLALFALGVVFVLIGAVFDPTRRPF
jgi:hypothetical protein